MTDSFFSGWDIAGAEDDPFALPNGTHEVTISKVEDFKSKNGSRGLIITFTGDGSKRVTDWNSIPVENNPANWTDRDHEMMSFLKRKFRMLGIPESRMNQVGPNDLIGIEATITVYTGSNGYPNVGKIKVKGAVGDDPFAMPTDDQDRATDRAFDKAVASLPPEEDDDDLLAGL